MQGVSWMGRCDSEYSDTWLLDLVEYIYYKLGAQTRRLDKVGCIEQALTMSLASHCQIHCTLKFHYDA